MLFFGFTRCLLNPHNLQIHNQLQKVFLHCFFHKIAFMSRRISSTFPDKASTKSGETVKTILGKSKLNQYA